ncbi:MAG: SGNH/GDSL hydrolase family protein [Lachnospiraceae bacterium]|nr:SGNH/GDSL hydrolase family protein [Lachnospiraceae bacterium]
MKRILCFGDSNTYGYKPDGSGRYDENVRWTGRLQHMLGEEYQIMEEGLCGRTTVFEDALRANRKGSQILPMLLETHNPLDLVIIMLGTNDCKRRYQASAKVIGKGMEQLVLQVKEKTERNTKLLLVSPIHMGKGVGEEGFDGEFDENSEETVKQLKDEYEKIALDYHCNFLAASDSALPSPVDREHLDERGHEKLAFAIYEKVREIFP